MRHSLQKTSNEVNKLLQEIQSARRSQILTPSIPVDSVQGDSTRSKFLKASFLLQNLKSRNKELGFDTVNSLLNIENCFHIYEGHLVCKYKKIRTLEAGTHFGELALLKDCDRSATVVAASALQVATLSKNSFQKMARNFNQSFQAKVDFFAKLIGRNPENSVARFCYGFKERRYGYGQKIYAQGEMPTQVFLVNYGEVQLLIKETQEKTASLALPCISKVKKPPVGRIAIVGPFSFIGQREALEEKSYEMTAKAHSNGVVLYVIPLKEFKNLRSRFSDVFEKLKEDTTTQMSYFETRIQDLASIKRRISGDDHSSPNNIPVLLDLTQIHSPKFFGKKPGYLSARKSPIQNNQEDESKMSPQSLFTDSDLHQTPLSQKKALKSPSNIKKEPSILKIGLESSDFLDISPKVSDQNSPSLNKQFTRQFSQEFNFEKTLKMLTEKAKLRRRSDRDIPNGPRPGMFYRKSSLRCSGS